MVPISTSDPARQLQPRIA